MSDIRAVMERLKRRLVRLVVSLERHSILRMKKVATEPGVYVFFGAGQKPIRIGSSINPFSRIKSQTGSIASSIASSVAREKGVLTYEKCGQCSQQLHNKTKEFSEILRSIRKVEVGFIPYSKIVEFDMGVRQFEGLLLWALRPSANSEWEPERLGRDGFKPIYFG